MTDILLRPAKSADLEAIVSMNHSLFQEDSGTCDPFTNQEWARQEGNEYFSNHITSDSSLVLVAEAGGESVGYLVGYVTQPSSVRPVKVVVLESMFVNRSERRGGIGNQLVDAFLLWSQKKEAQRTSVIAFASNESAIRFYRRCGFEPHTVTLERSV